jgi:hypothetical protein
MSRSQHRPAFDGNGALWRGMRDWVVGPLRPEALAPGRVLAALSDVVRHSGDLLALAAPGRAGRGAWREGFNKLRAFLLFAAASESMPRPGQPTVELPGLVERALRLDPYRGLWTTEGLGYFHATESLRGAATPRDLLGPDRTRGIPAHCLIPLHTGMGLAFATEQVQAMGVRTPRPELRRRIEDYLSLCESNAAPGYAGAAVESFGLAARNMRPRLVAPLGEELAKFGTDLAARFWHGYGRGLYFSPLNVLPCTSSAWPSVRIARREPPHELGRSNALAGLAWAVTLVNIRDPDVIELFLHRHRRDLADPSAFADGVRSAAAVWFDWAPQSPYLQALCRYRPRGARDSAAEQWDRYARGPCGEDFPGHYGLLKRENRLEELFRYGESDPVTMRA